MLEQMAADQARADRIRQLKADHPGLTWKAIAEHVGVAERSAIDWQKTGGIDYEHAKKLAELFPEVSLDYLWRGEAPDLLATMNGDMPADLDKRLQAIEQNQQELLERIDQLLVLTQIALTEHHERTDETAQPSDRASSTQGAAATPRSRRRAT